VCEHVEEDSSEGDDHKNWKIFKAGKSWKIRIRRLRDKYALKQLKQRKHTHNHKREEDDYAQIARFQNA